MSTVSGKATVGGTQIAVTATVNLPAPAGGWQPAAPNPSALGYPDATNTGVEAGVALKALTPSGPGWTSSGGSVTITGAGTVFEGYVVPGHINVQANNVTVKNCRITNNGEDWGIGLMHTKNATVSDVEILPSSPRLLVGVKDVYGDASGTQVLRSEIVRTTTGIQTHEGLIEDNYIHDMGFKTGDHINGTTSNGSTVPMTIRHNTIFNQISQTDAISLFQDFGLEANRVIENNLLAGGGYTIYAGQNAGAPAAHHIRVINNRISRKFFPNGGSYGPVTAYNQTAAGNEWSGNVWDEDGKPLTA